MFTPQRTQCLERPDMAPSKRHPCPRSIARRKTSRPVQRTAGMVWGAIRKIVCPERPERNCESAAPPAGSPPFPAKYGTDKCGMPGVPWHGREKNRRLWARAKPADAASQGALPARLPAPWPHGSRVPAPPIDDRSQPSTGRALSTARSTTFPRQRPVRRRESPACRMENTTGCSGRTGCRNLTMSQSKRGSLSKAQAASSSRTPGTTGCPGKWPARHG